MVMEAERETSGRPDEQDNDRQGPQSSACSAALQPQEVPTIFIQFCIFLRI
jgi:hypothetical protein